MYGGEGAGVLQSETGVPYLLYKSHLPTSSLPATMANNWSLTLQTPQRIDITILPYGNFFFILHSSNVFKTGIYFDFAMFPWLSQKALIGNKPNAMFMFYIPVCILVILDPLSLRSRPCLP